MTSLWDLEVQDLYLSSLYQRTQATEAHMNLDPSENHWHPLRSITEERGTPIPPSVQISYPLPVVTSLKAQWLTCGLFLQQIKHILESGHLHQMFPSKTLSSSIEVVHSHIAFRSRLKHSSEWQNSLPTVYQIYFSSPTQHISMLSLWPSFSYYNLINICLHHLPISKTTLPEKFFDYFIYDKYLTQCTYLTIW